MKKVYIVANSCDGSGIHYKSLREEPATMRDFEISYPKLEYWETKILEENAP